MLHDISLYQVVNLDSNFNDKFRFWHLPVFELCNFWIMVGVQFTISILSVHMLIFDWLQ